MDWAVWYYSDAFAKKMGLMKGYEGSKRFWETVSDISDTKGERWRYLKK